MPTLASNVKRELVENVMQRPNPDSIYYDEFMQLQKKLRDKIIRLRKSRDLVQEDMADYELSVRQYQRMEQDPTAIVSLWQVFKIAKAHNLDIHELLDL
jgi:predicted sulfurtransferase